MTKAQPPRLYLIRKFRLRHTGQYFLRGLLVIAPLLVTIAVVVWLFRRVDCLLSPGVTTPGLGLAILLLTVVLIGWISSFFFIRRTFGVIARALEHPPGISFIYSS